MRERPNRHAWKACEGQPSVGSNPTPSAVTAPLDRRRCDAIGPRRRRPRPPPTATCRSARSSCATAQVIAARHNERELTGDPTAHAEVLAIRDAAARRRPLAAARLHAVRHAGAVRDVRRRAGQRPDRAAGVRRDRPEGRRAWPACTRCAATRGSTIARPSWPECVPKKQASCCATSSPVDAASRRPGGSTRGGASGRSPCRRTHA